VAGFDPLGETKAGATAKSRPYDASSAIFTMQKKEVNSAR
jgi:hypothetical protein